MKQTIISQNRTWILFWVYVVVASIVITMLSSCGTRKVIINEVKKDSLSQIYTKIETKEDVKIETKNDIVIDNIISSEQEKWILEELDDLIRGFRRIANNYVGADCIKGCIEMISRDSLSDNYLDNKDDY